MNSSTTWNADMAIEILHLPNSTEHDPNQRMRVTCDCGCVFRFQRKDLNYDRRGVGWINCPNHCGRAVTQGFTYEG